VTYSMTRKGTELSQDNPALVISDGVQLICYIQKTW
jgi:hypothetical protein